MWPKIWLSTFIVLSLFHVARSHDGVALAANATDGILASTNSTLTFSNNAFRIDYCTTRRTAQLHALLTQLLTIIPGILEDANETTSSVHGYKAMFKDPFYVIVIKAIFRGIYEKRKVEHLSPFKATPSAPRFACAGPDTMRRYRFLHVDIWSECQRQGPSGLPNTALYVAGSKYTFVCPSFWNLPPRPEISECLTVANNRFQGSPTDVYGYQTYTLLYNMVRFYLGNASLNQETNPPERFQPNGLVGLSSHSSIINPTNYELYAASE